MLFSDIKTISNVISVRAVTRLEPNLSVLISLPLLAVQFLAVLTSLRNTATSNLEGQVMAVFVIRKLMLVFNIKKMFKIILYCVKLEQFGCQLPSHYWPGSELRPVQYSD